MSTKTKGLLLILLSAFCFGSWGVLSRLIGPSFDIFYQTWSRTLVTSLILLPIVLYRKEMVPIHPKDRGWFFVFLVCTSFTSAPIFYSFNHMDIGTASLLFFVVQLLTMYAIGFLTFNERLNTVKIVAFFLACFGLYFTFSFSVAVFPILAVLLAILTGLASGGEVAFSKKLSGTYSSLYVVTLGWITLTAVNLIFSLILHERIYLPELSMPWFWQSIYIAISVFGFWAVVEGAKHLEASIAGLIGLVEIVVSVAFGIFVFHETLTGRITLGAILILLAASLPHVYELAVREKRT